MIYADHAATTQLAPEALAAMMPYLTGQYGNASQPYSFAREPKKALKQARADIAECIGALPEEIYFTSGGTESDNWALKGIMMEYGSTRAVLTSQIEHHAVLNSCAAIERMGFPAAYMPVDVTGTLQPRTLSEWITDRTKLVSVMTANNEIGTIQPIRDLAQVAHDRGVLFHTDAVQAVGHIPIDVEALGVDMLSASAHKFNGPKGIGFLYVRKGTPLHAWHDGGAQERGMRGGTENTAAIAGMAAALKLNCARMAENAAHLRRLEEVLLAALKEAGLDFRRNGSENRIPGNMSLSFRGCEGEMLLHRLDLKGICVSTGSACDSVNTQVSHVLQAISLPMEYAAGTIRVSLGPENTEEEMTIIAAELRKAIRQ